MAEVKQGSKTTEWKALIATVAAAVATAGTALLSNMAEGTTMWLIISSLVALAGVAATYINARAKTKAAADLNEATSRASGAPLAPR